MLADHHSHAGKHTHPLVVVRGTSIAFAGLGTGYHGDCLYADPALKITHWTMVMVVSPCQRCY